uniref:L1 transposable element RRM domain-containing protein n=1 Tax=Phocoena sinus TaxID=42100 RepID=A0A8C9BUF7_PHOSS
MKRQKNTLQMKEQDKNPPDLTNEEEIGSLPEKEFRMMIVKMIQNLGNRIEKMQETFNKDLEELKMKQATMNTVNEIKNTLDGINSRITEAEERISVLEDKVVEITTAEQNKEKRIKRTEDSLRDLWDNIKRTNIRIISVSEEEEKKKGTEKIFEEIIVENFPNMGKEIVNQVQEAQRVPYRVNPRRNTQRHILIKLSKIKYKENILKAARENQQKTHKGIPIKLTADLSAETLQARRDWQDIFKVRRRKTCNQDYSTHQGSHSTESISSKIRKKTRMSTLTTVIQHSF